MQNANTVRNEVVAITDIMFLVMLKHKVMYQDPADADNFIFVEDLSEEEFAKRFAAAEAEAHALIEATDTSNTVLN